MLTLAVGDWVRVRPELAAVPLGLGHVIDGEFAQDPPHCWLLRARVRFPDWSPHGYWYPIGELLPVPRASQVGLVELAISEGLPGPAEDLRHLADALAADPSSARGPLDWLWVNQPRLIYRLPLDRYFEDVPFPPVQLEAVVLEAAKLLDAELVSEGNADGPGE